MTDKNFRLEGQFQWWYCTDEHGNKKRSSSSGAMKGWSARGIQCYNELYNSDSTPPVELHPPPDDSGCDAEVEPIETTDIPPQIRTFGLNCIV